MEGLQMASSPRKFTVPGAEGRTLSYAIYGTESPNATTIFYFHGYPASRYEASICHPGASARNIRLIVVDRPGMGSSTFQVNRKLTDWPADVLALADDPSIGATEFAVLGVSGGGPYALACLHALPPSRLRAVAIVAGLYPASLGTKGMLIESRVMINIAPWSLGTWLLEFVFDKGLASVARDTEHPERLTKMIADTMKSRPEPDKRVFEESPELQQSLAESLRGALGEPETGAKGAAWEAKIYGSDWGFKLEDLRPEGRLVMWHGTADVNSPAAMAEKARALIDGAELRLVEGEGHAGVFLRKMDDVLDTLKEKMKS
ncbi:alpha/beta-hydrolase [Thozetella sp. PMI_491]|nr:alpha/beta-hydrolase [Thozetella sp. PMI_491]